MAKSYPSESWSSGILYQHADDGGFVIVQSIEAAKDDPRPKTMIGGGVRYQDVRYKCVDGQPVVDFGGFEMVVTPE